MLLLLYLDAKISQQSCLQKAQMHKDPYLLLHHAMRLIWASLPNNGELLHGKTT